jgi:hypothetical protein
MPHRNENRTRNIKELNENKCSTALAKLLTILSSSYKDSKMGSAIVVPFVYQMLQ